MTLQVMGGKRLAVKETSARQELSYRQAYSGFSIVNTRLYVLLETVMWSARLKAGLTSNNFDNPAVKVCKCLKKSFKL
jgi:hypothetical protein